METRIPATQLARNLGDVLGRIRYRGESFVIERNGVAIARIGPIAPPAAATLGEALAAWRGREADGDFARDLAAVAATDMPADNPWD